MNFKNIIITLTILVLVSAMVSGVTAKWGYSNELLSAFEMDIPSSEDLDYEYDYDKNLETYTGYELKINIYYIADGADITSINSTINKGKEIPNTEYDAKGFAKNMTIYSMDYNGKEQYYAVYESEDILITIKYDNLDDLAYMISTLEPWAVEGGGIDFTGAKH